MKAIICDSRKGEGYLAYIIKPFRGNFWTNEPKRMKKMTEIEASIILKTLKFNNPRIVNVEEAMQVLTTQKDIRKVHE